MRIFFLHFIFQNLSFWSKAYYKKRPFLSKLYEKSKKGRFYVLMKSKKYTACELYKLGQQGPIVAKVFEIISKKHELRKSLFS